MSVSVVSQSITLKARAVQTVGQAGSFFLFISSTGSFQFSLDGGPWQNGVTIFSADVARDNAALFPSSSNAAIPPASFKSILFQDTSGAPNTIEYVIANGPVTYLNPVANTFTKDAPTYTKSSGIVALAAMTLERGHLPALTLVDRFGSISPCRIPMRQIHSISAMA